MPNQDPHTNGGRSRSTLVRHLHQFIAHSRQLVASARRPEVAAHRRWVASIASLAAVAVLGVVVPPPGLVGSSRSVPAKGALRAPKGSLLGSGQAGRAGVEESAIRLVGHQGGLPLGPDDKSLDLIPDLLAARAGTCSPLRLRVRWSIPVGHFHVGGYVEPLGPPPSISTERVNGVVLCEGSTYAYLGFEAVWTGHHWAVAPVPSTDGGNVTRLPSDDTAPGATPAQGAAIAPPSDASAVDTSTGWGSTIEPLADYQPQSTCDPTAKPGVVGLRDLLLHSFPGSRDLGIGQACDAPDGVSEHKEGRAFDWGVNIDNPAERAMAEQFLAWLFAPDRYGNKYAMARRLGIMYLIWDRHIWGSYVADQGWRPYNGVSPHTDHIHISFSWAGALGQTSFWSGHVADVGVVPPPPGALPPHADTAAPAPAPPEGTPAANDPGAGTQLAAGPPTASPAGAAPASSDGASSSAQPAPTSQPASSSNGSSSPTSSSTTSSSTTTSTSTTSTTQPPSTGPTLPPPPLPFP